MLYNFINVLLYYCYAPRPIIHREALANSRRKNSVPLRPVMDRSSGARRESGAQTDISALPAQWRSESYLAHKVANTFTTLPSKFALPTGVPSRLRLSDKTREARRVMLSDISFTSMVPELSRSADHLCHEPHAQVKLKNKLLKKLKTKIINNSFQISSTEVFITNYLCVIFIQYIVL